MVRKEFVITERQYVAIKTKAEQLGVSQNEILRRVLDTVISDNQPQPTAEDKPQKEKKKT